MENIKKEIEEREESNMNIITLKDYYDYFKKQGLMKGFRKYEYTRVVNSYFEKMAELILEGNEIRLPHKLGKLFIQGRKMDFNIKNKLPIDWISTKKLWLKNPKFKEENKFVYYINSHTDNYRYYLRWSTRNSPVQFKTCFKLTPLRTFRLKMYDYIVNKKTQYIEHVNENTKIHNN